MRKSGALALALMTAGCVPSPRTYQIPPQHAPVRDAASRENMKEYVRSGDVGADAYFVKDVKGLEGPDMRWTHAEPEFRFFLKSTAKRRFKIEFSVHDVTFRDTGPVTIVFRVNGHELERVRYVKPGETTFEKAVPADWLKEREENRVVMQILNPWSAPDPGVKLGVVLHGVGFLP